MSLILFINSVFASELNINAVKLVDDKYDRGKLDITKYNVMLDAAILDSQKRIKDRDEMLATCNSDFDNIFFKKLDEFEYMAKEREIYLKTFDLKKRGSYSLSRLLELLEFFDSFANFDKWYDKMFQYQPEPPVEDFPAVKEELLNWYFTNRFLPCLNAKASSDQMGQVP